MKPIPPGARGSFTLLVQPEHLANRFKDAMLPPVFATPVMIRVMENAALNAIKAYLVFCSGFDDFATLAKRQWVFWIGSFLLLFFVYYYDRNTTISGLTKAVMPLLACIGAVLPHVFRRVSLVYTVCSVLAGICGIVVLYFVFQTFLSPKTSFANGAIALVIVTFALASLGAGILSVASRLYIPRRASA